MSKRRRRPLLGAIKRYFDASQQRIYGRKELEQLLSEKRNAWHLANSSSMKEIVTKVLLAQTQLKEIRLKFPIRPETRYIWKQVSHLEVALSIRKNSYLSHLTAMQLHGLVGSSSHNIYVNLEQTAKPQWSEELTQASIDAAFKRPARTTAQHAPYEQYVFYLLNGKHTDNLAVVHLKLDDRVTLPVTSIERTLIDVAVRPQYSGGIRTVLQAYGNARGRVSIDRLVSILSELNYLYPYHQAIAFYLERSGACSPDELQILEKFPRDFDFYLDHRMLEKKYDKHWRIYYSEA